MLKNIKIVQYFGGIIVAFWISFGALALLAWLGLGSAANRLYAVLCGTPLPHFADAGLNG